MKSKILFLFFLSVCIISQEISYESLKRQGADYINPSSIKDKDLELEIELKNEKPVAPSLIGKFWCDPSIKLNTVRQDVMTNKNYNK